MWSHFHRENKNTNIEKLLITLLYKKCAHKLLVKLKKRFLVEREETEETRLS